MKTNIILKLVILAIVSTMCLSLFACDGGEVVTETPTSAPTEAPTDAPTETPTAVPTEAPTEVPTEAPTEAPTETPTEVPTETPTEVPTEVPTETPTDAPTEEPTEEPTEAEVIPVADYSYDVYLIHENRNNEKLYFDGTVDGSLFKLTEVEANAKQVRTEAAEGGFYMYIITDGAKLYINLVIDGGKISALYSAEPITVWKYNEELKTVVTTIEGIDYFLGTRIDRKYQTLTALDVKYYDNCKISFADPDKCEHEWLYTKAGHFKDACKRCSKPAGSISDHYFYIHHVDGTTTRVNTCTVCGYVAPEIPETIKINWVGGDLYTTASAYKCYNMKHSVLTENGIDFSRFTGVNGGAAQHIWTRTNDAASQVMPFSVGASKYLVMKVRANGDAVDSFRVIISTQASTAAQGKYAATSIYLDKSLTLGEWTYLIIDLEKAAANHYIAGENGEYVIDHLMFMADSFDATNSYDFEFMSFTENWAGVTYLTKSATSLTLVTSANEAGKVLDTDQTTFAPQQLHSMAYVPAYQMKAQVVKDDSGEYLSWSASNTVSQYMCTRPSDSSHKAFAISGNTKYMMIKVRGSGTVGSKATFDVAFSTLGDSKPTSYPVSANLAPHITEDWTTIIIDLNSYGENCVVAETAGANAGSAVVDYFQITMYNFSSPMRFDIGYISFITDIEYADIMADTESVLLVAKTGVTELSGAN